MDLLLALGRAHRLRLHVAIVATFVLHRLSLGVRDKVLLTMTEMVAVLSLVVSRLRLVAI